MKTYTIIGGVNGCGKSSLTGVLRTEVTDLGRIIDVDRITAALGGDAVAGGKEAIRRIEECITAGICFTQETTLSGHRVLRTVRRAIDAGYYIRLYYVGLDTAEESIRRIRNRVEHGGHFVSDEDVRRRFSSRFDALSALLPYCNEVRMYDNTNGFRAVAEYRNGELLHIPSDPPAWITALRQRLEE